MRYLHLSRRKAVEAGVVLALVAALALAGCSPSGAGGAAPPSPTAASTTPKVPTSAAPTATPAAPFPTAAATAAKPPAPTATASEAKPSPPTAAATQTRAPSPTAGAMATTVPAPTATRPPAPTATAVVAPTQVPPKSVESGPAPALSGSPTRRNEAGRVTIDVTWKNLAEVSGPITFKVVMDTHSVDLDNVDLSQVALLRNDQGREVKPEGWDAPAGGHHREGTLLFPWRDGSGSPLVSVGVKAVELVIRDVASVKERVLRWEVSG